MHGSVVGSYRSSDGLNWVLLCDQDTATWPGGKLVDNLQVGLAVSRGPQGTSPTAGAEFRQLLTSEQGPFPPTITSIPDQTIDEDTATAALPFSVTDVDAAAATPHCHPDHVPHLACFHFRHRPHAAGSRRCQYAVDRPRQSSTGPKR